MSTKKGTSQSSIFSFFHPVDQPSNSKENNIQEKSVEKRTHKDITDTTEEAKKLESDLAPINKTFPPKSKNEKETENLVKNMEQNLSSLMTDKPEQKKSNQK